MTAQLKAKRLVEYQGEVMTAGEAAMLVAKRCHGKLDWNGITETVAPSGLKKLGNLWLSQNSSRGDQRLAEFDYQDGTSKYSPYWKNNDNQA